MKKNKQVQNLFRALQTNPKTAFYTATKLTKFLRKKGKTAAYYRDKVFVNLYEELDDKNFYKMENLPLPRLFTDKKTNIDHSMLYSFHKTLDIADLRFLNYFITTYSKKEQDKCNTDRFRI